MNASIPFKTFKSRDGLAIRYGVWPCPGGGYRGRILVLTGRSEFLEKYRETISELNQRGLSVYAFDWRGQGLSDRMLADRHKGFVRAYDDYVKDLRQFVDTVMKPETGVATMVLAHSMGGHIALRFLHDHPGIFAKAVLTSPLIDIAGVPFLKKAIQSISGIAVRLGFGERYASRRSSGTGAGAENFKKNRLTHDEARFGNAQRLLHENPALAIGGVTFGWLDATFRSIEKISAKGYAEQISLPLLLVAAGADPVVSVRAQRAICRRMPNAQLVEIPGALHEILVESDPIRDVFWRAFDRFLGIPGVR